MASLTLDWLHVIVLLGAIQGVFLAGALASKRRNRTANRLLGAAFPLPFLFGPLIYLYAVSAADRNHRLTRLDALHFVPFLAAVLVGLPIYLMSGAEKLARAGPRAETQGNRTDPASRWNDPPCRATLL